MLHFSKQFCLFFPPHCLPRCKPVDELLKPKLQVMREDSHHSVARLDWSELPCRKISAKFAEVNKEIRKGPADNSRRRVTFAEALVQKMLNSSSR